MRVGRQVERWQSRDGKHVLRFFGRDEHVYFVEFSEVADKGETFWATTRTSEEFGSLETARKAGPSPAALAEGGYRVGPEGAGIGRTGGNSLDSFRESTFSGFQENRG
jgi:hypothetical protein